LEAETDEDVFETLRCLGDDVRSAPLRRTEVFGEVHALACDLIGKLACGKLRLSRDKGLLDCTRGLAQGLADELFLGRIGNLAELSPNCVQRTLFVGKFSSNLAQRRRIGGPSDGTQRHLAGLSDFIAQ
jgi:hypothetical protein